MLNNEENLKSLIGKTIKEITGQDRDDIYFTTEDGSEYRMFHNEDCCESVNIEEIIGDLNDLIGNPILIAEEITNNDSPPPEGRDPESYTWTFYKFATVKGYVDIRWFGTSNGYYSESVDFEKIK